MNTILTEGEIHEWWSSQNGMEDANLCKLNDFREVTRKVETAVLAKLREQEPVAWMREGWGPDCGPYVEIYRDDEMGWRDRKEWTPLYAAPQPAVVQVPQGWRLDVDESAIYHNDKRVAVLEEDGGNQSWRDACALGQQIVDRMNFTPEAPAQADEWLPLTAEEQNRLRELLKHARWLMQSMPDMDGLQNSWALNARHAMQRMHDWLKVYLPPAAPEAPAQGDVRDALRMAQAAAVMPLIGPLVDAWDGLPKDVALDDQLSGVKSAVAAITRAMLAAAPEAHPIPAPWREAVKVAQEALVCAKRWHQGDKWRDDCTAEQRAAWEEHAANLDAALAQLGSLGGGE